MALHKDFPRSPYEVLNPELRWVIDIFGNDMVTLVPVTVG